MPQYRGFNRRMRAGPRLIGVGPYVPDTSLFLHRAFLRPRVKPASALSAPLYCLPARWYPAAKAILDECGRGVAAMRNLISTICMLAAWGATGHTQTKGSKTLVDLEMMTWPELKQAI